MKIFRVTLPLMAVILLLNPYHAFSDSLSRKNAEGRVTVRVTYKNPGEPHPTFAVRMDTHFVNLDQYDLEILSLLRDDRGNEYRGKLESPQGSGHHRSGILVFEGVDLKGIKTIEIIIKEIAGIKERRFKWEMK